MIKATWDLWINDIIFVYLLACKNLMFLRLVCPSRVSNLYLKQTETRIKMNFVHRNGINGDCLSSFEECMSFFALSMYEQNWCTEYQCQSITRLDVYIYIFSTHSQSLKSALFFSRRSSDNQENAASHLWNFIIEKKNEVN